MIQLTQESPYKCFSGGHYSIKFLIVCDKDTLRVEGKDFIVEESSCHPTIAVKHAAGCISSQASEFDSIMTYIPMDPLSLIAYT